MCLTTDPNDPRLKEGQKNETGQHEIYLVLSEEERAKGFVRPVRNSYIHVGKYVEVKPGSTIEELPVDEAKRFGTDPDGSQRYFYFMRYPESESPIIGKALTLAEYKNLGKRIGGCGTVTTMGTALAETYARDPKFYGATYCVGCGKHLPVDEFVWEGTNELVGSLGPEFDDKGNIKDAKTYDKPVQLAPVPEPIVPTSTPVPLPVDLDDAIRILYDQLETELEDIYKLTENKFLLQAHHGLGRFLRNEWGLWSGSDIQRWFKNKGIHHADDMSSIILTSFYRKLNNKDINLDKQIKQYIKYWNIHNPDVNKGIT